MPLYEYECEKNGHRFELIRKFSDPPLKVCIYCKSKVRKLISQSAIAFKGTGWYVTDHGRKGGGVESGKGDPGKKNDSGKKDDSGKPESPSAKEPEKTASKDSTASGSKTGKKKD